MSEGGGGGGSTVDLPVAGKVKRTYVYVGAAVVAGIVGYAWWQRRQAGASFADPGIDDYTGGLQTGGGGTTTPGLAYNPGDDDDDDDNLPPTTNAQWVQRAVDRLEALGFDSQLVATVLGKYLARVPVTSAEADIIRTAEGILGKPPVGEWRIILVGTPPPSNNPPPPGNNPPPPAQNVPERVSVKPNYNLYHWTAEIAAGYGIPYGMHELRQLNPGIDKKIYWNLNGVDGVPHFRIPTPGPVKIR